VDVIFLTPSAPYEKSKFLGSGGSMVARLKLKEIDGRAPPGVNPQTLRRRGIPEGKGGLPTYNALVGAIYLLAEKLVPTTPSNCRGTRRA
jgi:hypothetical protein